ncbi:MAG: hypothetical protein ACREV8_16220, partial [Gammaproteobacteria bacterium]
MEHLAEVSTRSFVLRPACQLLGAPIQVVDLTGDIGGDNGIPDGRQCDFDASFFFEQGGLGTPAFRNLLLEIRDGPVQLRRPFLHAALELLLAVRNLLRHAVKGPAQD